MFGKYFAATARRIYWHLLHRWGKYQFDLQLGLLRLKNRWSAAPVTRQGGPVVSLTSYGRRLETVFITIESIASNRELPSRLILWVDDSAILPHLPASLGRLASRGLEILECEKFGPHTKYYPYIESCADFSLPLVTADDDVIYPSNWLELLLKAHRHHPDMVVCHRSRSIKISSQQRDLQPYLSWPVCNTDKPSVSHLALGVCGVLYPIAMQKSLHDAGRSFMSCCPRADDLWLHVVAIRAGFRIKQVSAIAADFPSIPGSQEVALFRSNQFGGENDRQIAATYSRSDVDLIREAVLAMQN